MYYKVCTFTYLHNIQAIYDMSSKIDRSVGKFTKNSHVKTSSYIMVHPDNRGLVCQSGSGNLSLSLRTECIML